MNFRNTLAAFIGIAILYLVWLAQDDILTGIKQAAVILFWVIIAMLIVAFIFIVVLYRQREINQQNRPIDGSRALITRRLKKDTQLPNGDIVPAGTELIFNADNMIGVGAMLHPAHGIVEITPAAGWAAQTDIRKLIETTHSLQAVTPGDNAMVRTHGSISQPKLPSSITKILPQPNLKPIQPASLPDPGPVAPPVAPIPTQQMIASPNPQTTKLAIGESTDANEIVHIDLRTYPYLRLHGKTQTGKTALALLLVTQALRHGYEVDIYDTRGGKDWGIFDGHANVIDARQPSVLIDGLQAEMQRYQERDTALGAHGAANLHDLAAATGQAYPRRLFVIEEMGNQTLKMKDQGKEAYRTFITTLRKITTEAGATGIHGLYIDQIPTVWDTTVRYNAAMICFYLPDHGGKVAGYPGAFNLAEYHCYFEGQIVRAGHLTDDQIRQTLGHVRRPGVGVSTGVNTPTNTHANTPTNGAANTQANTQANTPPPAPTQAQWEAFAALYFRNNPDASQRALTRAMAVADNQGRKADDFLGGLSSELFHKFSPKGNQYKPSHPSPADQHGWVGTKETQP